MSKTRTIDWPFIISVCNEENKPLTGIPVWIDARFANTDSGGEALFLGLEPGDYELSIDAADFRPLRKKVKIDRKAKNLGFILQGFATGGIKGNVRLSGAVFPLPAAEVKLTAVLPEETGAEEFSLWADWDGNYSSGYIPVGEYGYLVNAPLCEPKQGRLKIEKDTVLTLDVELNPVPCPAKITVNVKTDSGGEVKKSRVRLLEGMGAVTVAEKDGTDTCVFTNIDRAPFNQVQLKEKPFIGRNFVVAVDIEGYHTGYACGSLRSGNESETIVICRKITAGELVIKGIEESQPAVLPLDEAMKVQIPCEKKERFFKIMLPHPGNVTVKAGPNPFNTFLGILDKDLNKLADTWNYANQPLERTVQSGTGELIIGISGEIRDVPEVFSALIVNYQPIIDPYQPNNTFDSALPVEFGEIIRPFIFPQGDVNYFMVAVKGPGILRARLTDCVIHSRIRVHNPLGEEIVNTWNYANQPIDASCPVYKPGLYRISLSGTNPGDYTLAAANLKIDFIGTECKPEEFAAETTPPKPVRPGKRFGGTLFPGGKYNLYSFNIDRTGFIKIRFQLSGCHSKLRVLNRQGKEIYSSWNYGGQSLNPDIAIHEASEYFIEVSGTDPSQQNQGNFFIGIFFYPNDEYEGYQGNNSLETAAEIHIGQEVTAAIERPGDIDYYRFYVDHPGLLVQYTRTFPVHLCFIVDNPQGKEIFNSWNYAGQNLDREYHVLDSGYHILKVLGTNPNDYSPVSYGFRLEITRVKPESVQAAKNKQVLHLNSGMKLDALLPGGIKSFMLPVTAPGAVTIGAKIPIHARLIITGPDGKELFNSWNYAGQPLQIPLKLDAPATLQFTVQGTNPTDWSKDCFFIYAADGDGDMPPEPVLTLERIFEDNRKVIFNVSGRPADKHTIAKYELDFEGNGTFMKVGPGLVEHIYQEGKFYSPRLRVTDDRGAVGTESMFLDLTDVSLSGMSCRVVFPQDGDIVSAPGNVFSQACSGPGKPVKGMKLYLDGRLLAGNDLSHIQAELDWKSLVPGEHTIKAAAFSTDDKETQDTVTFKMADVFDLWPEDGKVITGSRAVITWFSPIPAATQVEYRKAGAEKWEKAEGQQGREHRVVLEGLEAGITYEFRAGDGHTWSEMRPFTLQKGLSFERPRYGVTIPREYGQRMPITVRNNSDHLLEVVLECLPPDDKELLVGFVGEGSEDRPIHLPPGEVRQYMLALSAQDCIRELHRFPVRIRSKDGFSDQAEVEVMVKIPRVDLQWEELETNPNTLGKKLRLVNKGDGLTDLTVRTGPVGAFRLRPTVEHALLPVNASLELWVDPVLYDGFKNINGEVKIETFGKTFSHKLECAVPGGMQVYRVTVDPTWWELISSWFCTNRPRILSFFKITPFLEGLLHYIDKGLVPLCEEWLKANPQLKDKVRSELLMTRADLLNLFLKAEEDYNSQHKKYPHSGETNVERGYIKLLFFLVNTGAKNIQHLLDNFYTGKEVSLYKELANRIRRNSELRFSPGDLYRIGLELCDGDQFEALLTCHNMLRAASRGQECFHDQLSDSDKNDLLESELQKYSGESVDLDLLRNHLVPIREENGRDDSGGYYHLFGTAVSEYQSEQDTIGASIFLASVTTAGVLPGALAAKYGIGKLALCALGLNFSSHNLPFYKIGEFYSALWTILNSDKDREGSRAAHLSVLLEERVIFTDPDVTEYCLDVFGISIGFNLHKKAMERENKTSSETTPKNKSAYLENRDHDILIYKCPVSVLVVNSLNQWCLFDQQNGRAYGTLQIPWIALPSGDEGWTIIHSLPRNSNHTIHILPVKDGSLTMSRSSKKLKSSAFFQDIPLKKGEYLTFSHVPDDLNQSISSIHGTDIKPTEIYKAAPTSQIKKEFAGLLPTFNPYHVDWSKASQKKSKYSDKSIDWWMIEPDEDNPGVIISEDTDGDGVIDFIHADTTGDGKIDYSAMLMNGKWSHTNLVEAWLEVNFSLPWARSAYIPHNVDIYFNGVKIASFKEVLLEGHYAFPIPPRAIRFPGGPENENCIELKSEHLRGGHYVVTSDFQVVYRLTEVDTFVIAESREAAEKKVYDTPGFRFKGMDLGVNSNDITISKQGELTPGERVEITANIHNLGMDPGKDVTVALLQAPVGTPNSIEVARMTLPEVPLYGPKQVKFTWTTVPGEQALRVVIDPDKTLDENSRFNNEALLIVKVSGKDNPPQIEITLPEEGKKFDSPKVKLEARGIDESGISLMEYRIDGGLWIQRKGDGKISEDIIIQPGEHIVYFRAVDCSGNQTETSRRISVECIRPSVVIESPAEGEVIAQDTVTVKVALENPETIKTMEARTADGAWATIDITGQKPVVFDLAFEFGKHPLEVKVTDITGVEAVVSRMVEITAQKK